MILIISTCREKLSESEFVRPLEELAKKLEKEFFTKHYTLVNKSDLENSEKVIISGTAVKDFRYYEETAELFKWIREFKKPLLGICAGFQIISEVFNEKLTENEMIGQFDVSVVLQNKLTEKNEFPAYFVCSKKATKRNFNVIAFSGKVPVIIKHKEREIYGILFHPEVMNEEIVINFCNL
ncbi:MAG: hypothetical protein PHW96_02505 [Candidatus Nanoarchaeia archaeon]|nr:hypothetical protein [Candidatus Nanoarchaeia archaeon]